MSLLSRLQRRLGRFAIPNLTSLLIVGQVAVYMVEMTQPGSVARILFDPTLVAEGEIWRVFTFLFTPPFSNPLFALIFWLLLYRFGTALEQEWGTFRYNLFLLIGYLANVGAAFAGSAVGAPVAATNSFLYGTIFLAFARLFPDYVLYLMFVLPVKVKWLALLQWILYAHRLLVGPWVVKMLVIASVLNYLLFFGRAHWRDLRHWRRRQEYRAKTAKAAATPLHECRVCGLDSAESPRTMFRYCSKCAGQQCYCPEHIRDHEHVES